MAKKVRCGRNEEAARARKEKGKRDTARGGGERDEARGDPRLLVSSRESKPGKEKGGKIN